MKQVVQRRFQHLVLKKRQCGIENFLSEAQDYTNSEININEIFESATEASLHFGKGRGYVSNIMRKDKPSDLGYHFKYL